MKIACSSSSFARDITEGALTHLEWLDACANELEVDGVVFDLAQFPRTNPEYLAQLKKHATDLGLTVAGVYATGLFTADGGASLASALALGAPLAIGPAATANDDAGAWGDFVAIASARAREAKRANVTLAVRNVRGTVCATHGDLKRLAKDVDSSWLRFAFDRAGSNEGTASEALLAKSTIVWHEIAKLEEFAMPTDADARAIIERLARFRGFVVLGGETQVTARAAYHAAIERFANLRARALATAP